MPASRRVVVVDRSPESREVLRTLLARTGVEVHALRDPAAGARCAAAVRPHLVIADVETPQGSSDVHGQAHERLSRAAAVNGAPIVILGTLPRGATPSGAVECIAKPYQYGALIRRIEELLERPS